MIVQPFVCENDFLATGRRCGLGEKTSFRLQLFVDFHEHRGRRAGQGSYVGEKGRERRFSLHVGNAEPLCIVA